MALSSRRLPLATQRELMARIVGRSSRQRGRPSPVVVFDLDGTVMDNRPRTLAILRELGGELRAEAHAWAETFAAARPEDLSYLMTDTLRALGLDHPELAARADAFWRARFFTDPYLCHDVPVAGSVDLARACYGAGASVVYFTARDLPLMGIGSFQSLRDLGFPIGVVGTALVCKPHASIDDEVWKRAEGPSLERVGPVVAVFDNEPGTTNAFASMYPEADVVFVDTQHLPGAPPLDPRVHVVADLRMR